jgi:hypothetical protein
MKKRDRQTFIFTAKEMFWKFDRETARGLKARAAPKETPTETLLRERKEARQAELEARRAREDAET